MAAATPSMPRGALTVRPATEDDLPAMQAIERASFGDPWSRAALAQAVAAPEIAVAVAQDAAGVAGYVIVRTVAGEAELLNVAVHPERRRGGIGRTLLTHAIGAAARRDAHTMFLEVRPTNAPALALYRALGFVPVGRRRDYYHSPVEDALVLRRGPAVRP